MKLLHTACVLASGLTMTPAANAVLRAYTVTGEITAGRNFFNTGDPVTMSFSYDDAATGTISSGGTQGSYVGEAQGVYPMELSISYNGGVWSSTATTGNIAINNPGTTGDSFQVTSTLPPATWTSPINGYDPEAFKIELISDFGNPFDNVDLPSSLSISDFNNATGTIYLNDFGFFSSVQFSVTDIQAVPEPGHYALLAGIATLGILAYRRRRK